MLHAITSGDFHGQIGPSSRMTNGNPNVLHVTGLTKSYRTAGEQVAVLRGVNLSVAAGESVALTGESGSGKSTLLHLIAGLDAADGGEITLDGTAISALADTGRALATRPLLLLADEPTGNLDEATADEVLALARDLVSRTGCGFLMVTHSARLAATLDRQVNLHAGVVA
jgi:putative ABC transport system ATP-binding protein